MVGSVVGRRGCLDYAPDVGCGYLKDAMQTGDEMLRRTMERKLLAVVVTVTLVRD